MSKNAITLKIAVIGEFFVGKTSVVNRFVDGTFDTTYSATIGFNFLSKTIEYNGTSYILNIWDTSGSERYRSVTPNYYRGADGCILVYDLSNPSTLDSLSYWYEEFKLNTQSRNINTDVPAILIGNKADLDYDPSIIAEAEQFVITHKLKKQFITSALTGAYIDEIFNTLVDLCADHQNNNCLTISLIKPDENENKHNSCC